MQRPHRLVPRSPSGASRKLPIAEDSACTDQPRDQYGIQKARIADLLKRETADGGLITTSLHPGHIVGPGWQPIGPVGNLDETLWTALSSGRTIDVPGSGTETLHHVHADDVAQAFERAVENRDAAAGGGLQHRRADRTERAGGTSTSPRDGSAASRRCAA
ncbi:NAD-dependent epimerase/dehydratase family protein [Microbacterium sp. nov. GSS16]|uniref:NAD-dependent epimerase/dehydratase family protein n=1 Tax=Microbacterium sp. nov. GSS16 TaxID=3019890 RepID=UPI0023055BF5|nr:NAD(P)-dependent oxidoreductase [Microbacterium sp. nov. GSS16]WCD92181.1 NAD(P)-dependent oxidoreductase [Microbacterium sp. nov. GSS16]